jgi:hypothetical protein
VPVGGHRLFASVKYLTYALLMFNIYLFLQEEMGSLRHTFGDGIDVGQLIQVFAATIDTAAWVILLLLFELETSVLDDRRIRGGVKLALHGIRGLCSVAIVYAFSGYCAELLSLYRTVELPGWNACAHLAEGWSLLLNLDKYAPLDAANCSTLGGSAIQLAEFSIVASPEVLRAVRTLAWTDVFNAAAWILVVVVLEVEVRLQLRGRLTDGFIRAARYVKYGLYAVLGVAAVYWGYAGDFLDFWDASLWLFAFIFIEMNVFDWQRETRSAAAAPAVG